MIREKIAERTNWKDQVEKLGFSFHSIDGIPYWDESACYKFSIEQINLIEKATQILYDLCIEAAEYVIDNKLYEHFKIPIEFIPLIEKSWNEDHPSIYGRFDLCWNGNLSQPPKMFEFNADTPTSLFEASIVQWQWMKDLKPKADQFNSIHEKLIAQWKSIKSKLTKRKIYFSCLDEFPEDYVTLSYLQDCANRAGISTEYISIENIGWNGTYFTDTFENHIDNIFKLYPWEWMIHEDFGSYLLQGDTLWIEPTWKMLLSNKAILPILWQLFPNHPNLLECYFNDPHTMKSYVAKPLLSREGANVSIIDNESLLEQTKGEYGEEGFIYQELSKLPDFDGNYPVIGSWIVGHKPAGIGIRESKSLVTSNTSRFIPHYFL